MIQHIRSFSPIWTVAVAALVLGRPAAAVDLTVSSIEVIQAVQYGSTVLVGGNVTWVRAKIGTGGAVIPGVDAALRMTIDGVPQPLPPVFSLNGSISAPITPNSANINDTVNFAVIPPVSNNVMFTVEVNPNRSVEETSYANNTLSVTKAFACRKVMEVTYVPIDYTFNGAGLPPANLMEPGIGDGFMRGIYKPGEWNYHKAPLPPLVWNQNINTSNSVLLNTLADILNNQLPAAGQSVPDFIYGWLPGNPYSGNGQAGGIPSDRAFGNTDPSRFQRTMAHELGHCFGLSHNSTVTNTVGVDVEWHLKDTQNQPQIMPTNRNDIMVAGLLTNQAWVANNSYNTVHNDARMQCPPALAFDDRVPVLRVSGVINNAVRDLSLDPVTRIALAEPTVNDPNGDTTVIAYDANGNELVRMTVRTDSNREMCSEQPRNRPLLDPTSGLYVLLPETINGQAIHRVEVIDVATKRVTGQRTRSARAPQGDLTDVAIVPAVADGQVVIVPPGGEARDMIRVAWDVSDEDGDALTHTLLYSPDGGASWLPLVVNTQADHFDFNTADVPASRGAVGRFRLVSTDGLNVTETDSPTYELGVSNPPETYLITPNNNATFLQEAPVAFHAASWDVEDGMLTGSQIEWVSSVDGMIGTGQLFIRSDLSPGMHIINVTGRDSTNQTSARNITLFISPRTVISTDCNDNGVLDSVDISSGFSTDNNANSVPDECEKAPCGSDISPTGGNNVVDIDDLLAVINSWGSIGGPADVNSSGTVDIDDLLTVIISWGPCP
jgi:hypothetical protein